MTAAITAAPASPGTARPAARVGAGAAVWLVLLAVSLLAFAWRLRCIQSGPDPDTDAYGHYLIARTFLETPLNFKLHWVWLPLYHVLCSLPVGLGASLDQLRALNALLALLPPLLWLGALLRTGPAGSRLERAAAGVAALLFALNPLYITLATTGQMEVFFCLLVVLAVALLARERWGWAAAVLGALVLTRYEGWAVAAVVGAELGRRLLSRQLRLGSGLLACLLLPGACVLGWAALRASGGEPWFGFLFDNQAFAERVLDRHAQTHTLLSALARYTLAVPYRAFGLALPFVLLGIPRTLARRGVWFVAPGLGLVAFLTLTSLSRSQLGLDRHFVSVVPFVALWVAEGALWVALGLGGRLALPLWARRGLVGACALLLGFAALDRLAASLPVWMVQTYRALPGERALASFLRTLPPGAPIACHESALEVLSGLPASRFVRTHVDASNLSWVQGLALGQDLYVVDRASHVEAILSLGTLVHGAPDGPPEAFVALRLPAAASLAGVGH